MSQMSGAPRDITLHASAPTRPARPPERDPLLNCPPGQTAALLGNEAIVRAALESGVAFACGYPGTPSSEVTDSFARVAQQRGVRFEYSVNEKVCVEMAFAASLAGARSICAMKHLGLMVAGDPLSTIPYIGVRAGMVIVSAGDPSCLTSPNEQDQRHLGPMLHVVVMDPSTPQAAYDLTLQAFEISEASRLPVLMRITTRVAHTRAAVRCGELRQPEVTGFVRDPAGLVPVPHNARRMRLEIDDRLLTAGRAMVDAGMFQRSGTGRRAILATGAPAATCRSILADLDPTRAMIFCEAAGVYPLPEAELLRLLGDVDEVLVIEELSPYLEDALRALASLHGLTKRVLGKRTGHLPTPFEYEPQVIREGLAAFGLTLPGPAGRRSSDRAASDNGAPGRAASDRVASSRAASDRASNDLAAHPSGCALPAPIPTLPARPPSLCPGCPHRSTYFAARAAFDGDEHLYFNDIGCYTLGYGEPLNTVDALLCMGAGFTLAAGVARVTGRRTVGFMGDSTFFHSGMPALLNAVKEQVGMVAVILDNQVTAMTGFQESPTVAKEGSSLHRDVSIAEVCRALGVKQVEVVDPTNLSGTIAAFERARDSSGVSVVIAEEPCPLHLGREMRQSHAGPNTFEIDQSACRSCGRSACGMRCGQVVEKDYERQLARNRALWIDPEAARAALRDAPPAESFAVAPCAESCPIGICIQGYAAHIAAGRYDDALELILDRCPLPATVCRVCHRPCESDCVHAPFGNPVAINDLKRFVVERAPSAGRPYDPPRDPPSGKSVAVVGAGPAGLAAAHDLALRGHSVALYDAADSPGGLLAHGIPGFRLPREAVDSDVARILGLGVRFEGGRRLGDDLSLAELLGDGGHDAVLLAFGAHAARAPRLEGAGSPGAPAMVTGLDYLKRVQAGMPAATGRRVVVVGGGNTAFDAARTALRRGAEKVAVVYRRRREELPALSDEIEGALEEGVQLRTQLQPEALVAAAGGRPAGVVCIATRPGAGDASGRSTPVMAANGEPVFIEADLVIAATGQAPDTDCVAVAEAEAGAGSDVAARADGRAGAVAANPVNANGATTNGAAANGATANSSTAADRTAGRRPAGSLVLERAPDGSLVVDDLALQTSHPRVFAAGDVTGGQRTVTTAIAQGQRAAWGVDRALRGREQADLRPPPPRPGDGGDWPREGRPASRFAWGGTLARRQPPAIGLEERTVAFDEVYGTLDEASARAEAARCQSCGQCANCRACLDLFGCPAFYVEGGQIKIDAKLCNGCGVCAELCPNGAIVPRERPTAP